jgi:hypothetical protein
VHVDGVQLGQCKQCESKQSVRCAGAHLHLTRERGEKVIRQEIEASGERGECGVRASNAVKKRDLEEEEKKEKKEKREERERESLCVCVCVCVCVSAKVRNIKLVELPALSSQKRSAPILRRLPGR